MLLNNPDSIFLRIYLGSDQFAEIRFSNLPTAKNMKHFIEMMKLHAEWQEQEEAIPGPCPSTRAASDG